MAKKRKGAKRRVGAASLNPGSPIVKLAAIAAGYFLTADPVNTAIDKANTKAATATEPAGTRVGETVVMGGELGLGALLLLSKSKNKTTGLIKTAAGGVLAGAGLKRALKKFGVIKGYQSVPVIGSRRMAGYQSVPVIGGVPGQLQGVPPQLNGYRSAGSGVNGYTSQGSGVLGSCDLMDR